MQVVRVLRKLNVILSKHQKVRMVELIILMIIGGVLETFSVSLILPFMNVVMEPEKTMQNKYVSCICDFLGIESSRSFLVFLAIVLALIYLFKNFFLLFEYNYQYRFAYGNMLIMQRRLLDSLIRRPYEFFLKINSGEIIRIVNSDTPNTFAMLTVLLQLFTELIISGALVVTVFVMAPEITLVMAVILFLLVIIISRVLNPILGRAGEETQKSLEGMNKWLLQSIHGIKELKVTNRALFFEKQFNQYGSRYVVSLRKNSLFGAVPRFVIEAVCMCAMFGAVAFMIYEGVDLELIIPILTAVAMSAMRLLPSINRISQALATVSYSEPMLDKLIENLKDICGVDGLFERRIEGESETDMESRGTIVSFDHDIRLKGITYCYPGTSNPILDDVDIIIEKGQSIGIVGVSGAGKTTAVDVLLGLLDPMKGQVLIDGTDIKEDMPGFLNQVGYIPQNIFMLDDNIRANVAFGEEDISDDKVWRALSEASLVEFVQNLPDGLDTEIGERGVRLSGGQKQRIGIARALFRNPSVLIFDEATSALDNETEESIMESINSLRGVKTMIIIAHRLTTIEKCDVVYRVENGRIIEEK